MEGYILQAFEKFYNYCKIKKSLKVSFIVLIPIKYIHTYLIPKKTMEYKGFSSC